MKIVMVGDFPPRGGGISSHIYSLSKQLIKEGHEVFVITYYNKNLKDIDGIHVIGTKIIDKPIIRPIMFTIKAKRKLKNLIQKENIDIIHGHTLGGGIPAVNIGKKYNIPTYITAHGEDIVVFYEKNIIMKKLVKKTLNKADKILAVSNYLIDKIKNIDIKNIDKKTSLHLNAVDINKFKEKPKKSKQKPTVIFVGSLIKRKNPIILLDAKKHTKTDFNLIFVGDGPEKDNLENKIKNENIKNVTFTGIRKDVENILPQADLFVLPSFVEGLSVALIEALACGLPVIGSNIGGMNEVITNDVGLLIDPHDHTSLTNAIDKILSDENLYKKFRSNARKKAMEFSQMKIPYKEINP